MGDICVVVGKPTTSVLSHNITGGSVKDRKDISYYEKD
jgi:hypothetical protein